MSLEQQMKTYPWTWKDWVASISLILTVATVTMQGGRILERLDTTNEKLATMTVQIAAAQGDLNRLDRMLAEQRGRDSVHDEKLKHLEEKVADLRRSR